MFVFDRAARINILSTHPGPARKTPTPSGLRLRIIIDYARIARNFKGYFHAVTGALAPARPAANGQLDTLNKLYKYNNLDNYEKRIENNLGDVSAIPQTRGF